MNKRFLQENKNFSYCHYRVNKIMLVYYKQAYNNEAPYKVPYKII